MELVLTEYGAKLGKRGECLVVKRNNEADIELVAEDVATVTVISRGIGISSDAVELLIQSGGSMAFLKPSGEPYAEVVSPLANGRTALRRAQLRAYDNHRGVLVIRCILRGKLRNQGVNLRYFAKARKKCAPDVYSELRARAARIDAISESLSEIQNLTIEEARTTLMNREGRAAYVYWQGLAQILPPSVEFPGRVRKGASDPFNACLNYAYGMLYPRVWGALTSAGLDPYAGFLHADRPNQPSMAFDVIELFRAWFVDRPVAALFTKQWRPEFDGAGVLAPASRRRLAERVLERMEERVDYRGRQTRASDIIVAEVRQVARAIECGEGWEPYVAEW